MARLMQSVRDGQLRLVRQPDIGVTSTSLVVDVRSSLISSGTERSVHELAGSSLLQKARSRPDLVRAVVERAQQDGLRTVVGAVRARLGEDMPVGYSASGVVMAVGEHVSGFRVGDRIVTAGAGHADLQSVPGNLAARLPEGLSFDEGAFGAIASVALHGLRLAEAGPGSKVVVVGLGLVGQISARVAFASGCDVAGTDVDRWKIDKAQESGVFGFSSSGEGEAAVADWSMGFGADVVLVTAATKSSDPMRLAARIARDRSTIVAVGDVGLELERRSLYEKELTVKVSRAYGPGRYDPVYEDVGIDYPIGYVRWPIGRNLGAVLALVKSGRLNLEDLITHRFPFGDAVDAYDVFESADRYLGILLQYEPRIDLATSVSLNRSESLDSNNGQFASGMIGAGRFASSILLPNATAAGFGPWTKITSAGGTSAVRVGEENGFSEAVATPSDVTSDGDTDVVFVASQHDSHASIASAALLAGKHVFCEKPLAITADELNMVEEALASTSGVLMVGFNRRWSPAVKTLIEFLNHAGTTQILYRVHAGPLPDDHWLKDRRQGGRLLGEACHFIDTCNAIVGMAPRSVYTVGSSVGEGILDENFTVTLDYPHGSQAVIVYSSGSPYRAGKERLEVIRGDRSAVIDDFRSLTLRDASKVNVTRFKPANKGHKAEFEVFREAIATSKGVDELTRFAVDTSRVALGAVASLLSGTRVDLPI